MLRPALHLFTLSSSALLAFLAWQPTAHADPNRRGLQVEGMVGASACIPGRAKCERDSPDIHGRARPSFGTGATVGFRPFRWLMFGGLYRWGMFNVDYVAGADDYKWAGQHTVAGFVRPILPIWRFDLGLNLAPGFSRQVYRLNGGGDRDYSQGFAFLVGPTFDVYVTDNLFLGAEVDFIFNTQKKVCRERSGDTSCSTNADEITVGPTHQALFGFHIGGTFF